ncbi:hypothetical protein CCAN2_1810019 [Capnocytophaga canimorsus]|nr:hypothetical protein CCAN2_1810019 [Capnocytophaga canimorsus]
MEYNIQTIKQRFGIIGNDLKLNRAIEKAIQVAPTDISVLVTGEKRCGEGSYSAYYSLAFSPKTRKIHSCKLRSYS